MQKVHRQQTYQKSEVPANTFYIPMTIFDTVVEDYKAGIDIVDGDDRVYAKTQSTVFSGKDPLEQGYLNFKNGNRYEGPIVYGKMEGYGRLTFADNGLIYEGEFIDNSMTGKGKLTWNEDIYYDGLVNKGFRHGKGKYTNNKLGIIYDGEWCFGKIHGHGRLQYENGSVYEGDFSSGQRFGIGTMYYPSGNVYEGTWIENSKSTSGKMFWKDVMQSYEGLWTSDQPHGFGEYIWLQNNSSNALLTNRYHGNFKMGKRNGVGVYFYSNGSKYIGNWCDNLKQGTAIFIQEDGQVIKGIFEEDRLIEKYIIENDVAKVEKVNVEIDFDKNWDDTNTVQEEEVTDQKFFDPNAEGNNKTPPETVDKKGREDTETKTNKNRDSLVEIPTENKQIDLVKKNTSNLVPSAIQDKVVQTPSLETTVYNPKNTKGKKKNVDVNPNPYLSIIDVNDLYDHHWNIKATGYPWLMKILLSKHSDILHIYNIYRKKYEPAENFEKEKGMGMRMFAFWRFLIECRLMNTNQSIPAFNRTFCKNSRNLFDLEHDVEKVEYHLNWLENLIKRAKKEKEPSERKQKKMNEEDESNFLWENKCSEVDTDFVHCPNKILLFRQFVDALVRVIYLKTDNLDNLHFKLGHIIKDHILPICNQKMVPKPIFQDEELLMQKVNEMIEQYDELLSEVIDIILPNKEKLFEPNDRNYVKLKDVFNLFGIDFKPENKEKFMCLMIIIERYHDPEEAFIQKYKKRDKIKRGLDKFDKKIFKLFSAKLDFEQMDFEFKETIVLYMIKHNHIHIHQKTFSKKMMQIMNDFNNEIQEMKEAKAFVKVSQGERAFPLSQKDYDVQNINEVKERKRLEEEKRKQMRKQKEQEYKERLLLKKFDYDVPVQEDEVESEEEQFSEYDEKMDLGDSFYILKE